MSYARSPRDVCSTTMGTRTELPILPPQYFEIFELSPLGGYPAAFALLGRGQVLLFDFQRFGQIRDRVPPQIIHDTRTQGNPAIVHGARHVVGTLGEAAGALLIRRETVESFDDIEQTDITGIDAKGESAGRAFAGAKQTLAGELL